jgi:hypothetical protein
VLLDVDQLKDFLLATEGPRKLGRVVLATKKPVELLFWLPGEESVRPDFLLQECLNRCGVVNFVMLDVP